VLDDLLLYRINILKSSYNDILYHNTKHLVLAQKYFFSDKSLIDDLEKIVQKFTFDINELYGCESLLYDSSVNDYIRKLVIDKRLDSFVDNRNDCNHFFVAYRCKDNSKYFQSINLHGNSPSIVFSDPSVSASKKSEYMNGCRPETTYELSTTDETTFCMMISAYKYRCFIEIKSHIIDGESMFEFI